MTKFDIEMKEKYLVTKVALPEGARERLRKTWSGMAPLRFHNLTIDQQQEYLVANDAVVDSLMTTLPECFKEDAVRLHAREKLKRSIAIANGLGRKKGE
jgi:hypothetical protein